MKKQEILRGPILYLEFSESHYPWDSQTCFLGNLPKYYNVYMCRFKNFISNFKICIYRYMYIFCIYRILDKALFLGLLSPYVTKEKMFLRFCEILISLSLRDIHCILTHRHKPSMLAKHIIS